jgi:isoamylase
MNSAELESPGLSRGHDVETGSSYPLGATVSRGGVAFSVFSRGATLVELLLFDREDASEPSRIITLDPRQHHTYHYWHAFVPGLTPGQLYGYRARGPFEPARGRRFDSMKLLLDPYGLGVAVPAAYSRTISTLPGANLAAAMKSIVADPGRYDWEGDQPLRRPFRETIIYELHVRGFTRHPSSGVAPGRAGTYAGLVEKIPYLRDLGITAVELLPVFQFDAQDAPPGRVNYWGYSPVSFFAPHRAYSSLSSPLGPLDEFRDMVKALHRAGIEVILDVVFNHTAEGDQHGPTLSFRGLENSTYYILEKDRSRYANYSGAGNTLNASNAIVRRLIQDSLRHWVTQMHVDGFRFDLASILARDESGHTLPNPPVLWDIESDPVLAGTKLIAEAWDAAGLYQVGRFIGDSWHEWNGRFRDDVRAFLKGDEGLVPALAARLLGSPDLYGHEEREPEQSINFVTCHDGFTLNDLVSYNAKHNEANGEDNRDGVDDNRSWNCGEEGPTADPGIEALREQQIRNFFTLLLTAVGAPMLLMGDEVRRTQHGNNNAYCQDNESSWFDWTLLTKHADIHRFVKQLIAYRQRRGSANQAQLSLNEMLRLTHVEWHGVELNRPDWGAHSHSLAFTLGGRQDRHRVHVMLNAYWEALQFQLPRSIEGAYGEWHRVLDTSSQSPPGEPPEVTEDWCSVQPRSIVVLVQVSNVTS